VARHPQIVNRDAVEPLHNAHGTKYALSGRSLGVAAGSQKLGCTLYQVPPGKTAFPAHVHHANEEAVYILSGTGTLRLGAEQHPVGAGDFLVFHASGPAHQLFNTGDTTMEYLCISTLITPEVVEYPDSGKMGTLVGDRKNPVLRGIYKKDAQVGYYDDG
jgi:uncharacterized cupin superfamily protein